MPIENVLLVDDDPDIRTIAELSLATVGGWKVQLASSGADALCKLSQFTPDVLLLDVMMPHMDGPTLLSHLKSAPHTANIPVIFMTAKVQRHEVQAYLDLGAVGVISKPFDPMQLAAEVEQILKA